MNNEQGEVPVSQSEDEADSILGYDSYRRYRNKKTISFTRDIHAENVDNYYALIERGKVGGECEKRW